MVDKNTKAEEWVLKISQASPAGLLIINYELLLETLADGKSAVEKNEPTDALRDKAIGFLQELIYALDMSYEISHTLFQLYIYVQKQIIVGMNHKNPDLLHEAMGIIESLNGAFKAISHTEDNKEPVIKNAQQIYAGLTYGKAGVNESVVSGKNKGFKA